MKKLLISIIGIMLLIALILSATKGLAFGKAKVYSVNQLKEKSGELDSKIEEAKTETTQNYAKSVEQMNTASKRLKDAKEEYESKLDYLNENPEIGITQIEKYKIEYLWGIIGNYAKSDGLKVDLNIEETSIKDTYDINFTLTGSYLGITNFLYHIENDDELNYKVTGFKIEPNGISTTTSTGNGTGNGNDGTDGTNTNASGTSNTETTTTDVSGANTDTLRATFKVENIIINFN